MPDDDDREVASDPVDVPSSLAASVAGRSWFRDSAGEAGGAVHRLAMPGEETLYLKHGVGPAADDISDEFVRLRWLGGKVRVPVIRRFVATLDEAWLLMTAVPGRTAWQVLTNAPERRRETVAALAAFLRELHALPVAECPFAMGHPLRMAQVRRRLEAGLVDEDDFGDAHEGWTAERVWARMTELLPIAVQPVVTHGDFSLDNILMQDGRVTGVIDVGRAGLADRHQDLAILLDCLGEFDPALQDELFRCYGVEPDERRIEFHLCLDEMF